MAEKALSGKIIVVNGGTKGIGRAVAIEAGRQGATVVVGGRNAQDGGDVVNTIKAAGSSAIFVQGDCRKVEDCERLIATAVKEYGRIDGLVNYAGILPASLLTETEEELFDDVLATNTKAPFFITKFAVRSMLKTGGGSIVNVGSMHGYGGEIDRAAYAVSKGALLTLTKHIARNYAKEHIRANWITIGWVATPGELALRHKQGRGMAWLEEMAREALPMGRLQTYEDNVPAFIYLLSDASDQVTGTEIHVTGGRIM
ncbi:MAG: SDR family oxidoreductase [Rectinemataceae bacterium]|jgi:NAD(P)-dependent dehydrogenase (short-subunit alcohol dehydrogenase family)